MKDNKKHSIGFFIAAIPITAIITIGLIYGSVIFAQNFGKSEVNNLLDDFEKEFLEQMPSMPELEDGTEEDFVESENPVIVVPENKNEDNKTENNGSNVNTNTTIETNTEEPKIEIEEPKDEYKEYTNTIGIIEIPSIKVKAPIALGTSNKILNKQVGQYKTTDPIGQPGGSTGFAAHSGARGWDCWYCYFNDIGKLKKGAEIVIKWQDGKTYTYKVTEVKTKQDPKTPFVYERDESESRITLTTCTNGDGKYRTFVRGVLKEIK